MSTYKMIINGQEVEVTVIDQVEVDRTKQSFLASEAPVSPIGMTGFLSKDGEEYQQNFGYRKVPIDMDKEVNHE